MNKKILLSNKWHLIGLFTVTHSQNIFSSDYFFYRPKKFFFTQYGMMAFLWVAEVYILVYSNEKNSTEILRCVKKVFIFAKHLPLSVWFMRNGQICGAYKNYYFNFHKSTKSRLLAGILDVNDTRVDIH